MFARFLVGISALALLSCGERGAAEASKKGGGKKGGGDVPVALAKVTVRDVPVDIQVIGNVEAFTTVSVKSRVTGPIDKIHFREGDFIAKGDKLASIDPAPFASAVNQAEANLARERALLLQARANLSRDEAQLRFQTSQASRFADLFKQGVISKDIAEQHQSIVDVTTQALVAGRAAIASAEAAIQASEAALKTARIQLGYASIASPVEGRSGNVMAHEGNLATGNVTEIVQISQVQPVYVSFAVPESQLGTIKDAMARGRLPVTAAPPDDPANPETGTLTFVDSSVDANTGTIRLKAQFANARRKLWPGQFVRVSVRLGMRANALMVPNQAVQTGQDGSFVYRVKENNTVEVAKVTTAGRVDEDIVIGAGLEAGDTVVTEGQLRLAPGMRIRTREANAQGKGGGGTGQGKGKGKGKKKSEE